VEFEIIIDKRKQKPIAINIIPTSPEIIGENRVEGTIAVIARQQQSNGVLFSFSKCSLKSIDLFLVKFYAGWKSNICKER